MHRTVAISILARHHKQRALQVLRRQAENHIPVDAAAARSVAAVHGLNKELPEPRRQHWRSQAPAAAWSVAPVASCPQERLLQALHGQIHLTRQLLRDADACARPFLSQGIGLVV